MQLIGNARIALILCFTACGTSDEQPTSLLAEAVSSIAFVQQNQAVPQTPQATVWVPYYGDQTAGDLNVVIVGWNDTTANVASVTDTQGNTYQLAIGPTQRTGAMSQSIYYAKNIVAATANANTVTVTFDQPANFADIRIFEYSGIDKASPLDVAVGASGNDATSSSGNATTTNADDLLIGANTVETFTSTAGAGYTVRVITSPDGDIAEDQVVSATGTYSATASLSLAGQWVMQMVAFKATDKQVPSAPSNLVTKTISGSQLVLIWTAATDNVGVTGYLVERCTGAGCTTFAQIGTAIGTGYSDDRVTGSTSYSYRVRATDAAGNLGAYSNVASVTTPAGAPTPPTYAQGNSAVPQTPQSVVTVPYTAAQAAGALNVVVVGWSDATAQVNSVTDSSGNVYALAVGPTVVSGATQSIYYAKNVVAATANAVTVCFTTAAVFPDIRIAEYRGMDTAAPVDVAVASAGSSATSSSGAVMTTNANDLLVAANLVVTTTSEPGTGFTSRILTTPDGDILEDRVVTATGSYSATAPLTSAGGWIMQMVAFKAAPAGPNTQAPTTPGSLAATAASSTRVNLNLDRGDRL